MGSYKIMSADDHVFEPADLFTSRMKEKLSLTAAFCAEWGQGRTWPGWWAWSTKTMTWCPTCR